MIIIIPFWMVRQYMRRRGENFTLFDLPSERVITADTIIAETKVGEYAILKSRFMVFDKMDGLTSDEVIVVLAKRLGSSMGG